VVARKNQFVFTLSHGRQHLLRAIASQHANFKYQSKLVETIAWVMAWAMDRLRRQIVGPNVQLLIAEAMMSGGFSWSGEPEPLVTFAKIAQVPEQRVLAILDGEMPTDAECVGLAYAMRMEVDALLRIVEEQVLGVEQQVEKEMRELEDEENGDNPEASNCLGS
jgi:hypothetical protein